jgi:hypothetical protein
MIPVARQPSLLANINVALFEPCEENERERASFFFRRLKYLAQQQSH